MALTTTGHAAQHDNTTNTRCDGRTHHQQQFNRSAQIVVQRGLHRYVERTQHCWHIGPESRQNNALLKTEFPDEFLHLLAVFATAVLPAGSDEKKFPPGYC